MPLEIEDPQDTLSLPIPAIGIDLGTTHSLVAFSRPESNTVEFLNFSDDPGHPSFLLPSVVEVDGQGQLIPLGCRKDENDPSLCLLRSVKRLMGKTYENAPSFPYPLCATQDAGVGIELARGQVVTPVDVATILLKHMYDRVEQVLGYPVRRAVITVPAYFDERARLATKEAAFRAGFDVMRLLNEPTAAALAYGIGGQEEQGTQGRYGVYDLGGGTFDFSFLKMHGAIFDVQGTGGDRHLGGDDMDEALCRTILGEVVWDEKSLSEQRQCLRQARRAKEKVSTQEKASLFGQEISRETVEKLSTPLIERTINIVEDVLARASIDSKSLKALLLVGGATRMPWVRKTLSRRFSCPILDHFNPDRIVAEGAALQALSLVSQKDHLLLDVTPLSLGLETMGGLVERIIPRNTRLPTSVTQVFTTAEAGQTAFRLHIVQGEREQAKDCLALGTFELRGIPPMPAGQARLEVTFSVDANGLLHVGAKEKHSGIEQNLDVAPLQGMTFASMQDHLASCEDHEAEDFHHRLLTQKQLDAKGAYDEIERILTEGHHTWNASECEQARKALVDLAPYLETSDFKNLAEAIELFTKRCLPLMERRMASVAAIGSGSFSKRCFLLSLIWCASSFSF